MQTLTRPDEGGIWWSPDQIKHLRRKILQEDTRTFCRHFCLEDGKELRPRTVESWDQGLRRPSYFVRQQMSSAFRELTRRHPHVKALLPANPD
jgi:hypothetical protein